MFKEMLEKKWVPDVRLANPSKIREIEAGIENFKKTEPNSEICEHYRKFYTLLCLRINEMQNRLLKTATFCDKLRFPSFDYINHGDFGEIQVRGSCTGSFSIMTNEDGIKYAAANLCLAEIIEAEVGWEISLYDDFDKNYKELCYTAKSLEYLGAHMEFRRPLINVVVPTDTVTDPLGYRSYELTASRFNCDRLLTTVESLIEERDRRYDKLLENAESSPSEKLV